MKIDSQHSGQKFASGPFPKANIQYVQEIKDPRSYNVNFDKIEKVGFKLSKEIKPTVEELRDFIKDNNIDLKAPQYYNYHP